ncbi:MAG TPA: lipocalin family protein [Candidatus Solibacter sp.]|nr:lipocalin family protein [Candidatus Solibacter sp.]
MIRIESRASLWCSLAVVTLLGCWACGGGSSGRKTEAPAKTEAPRLSQDALIGKWRLESIEGKPPTSEDIETWTVEFKPDGNWSYTGQMTQRFARMPLGGAGTWKLNSGVLEYSSGNNKGRSTVTLGDGLTLSPDPVIAPDGGKYRVVTVYKRAS